MLSEKYISVDPPEYDMGLESTLAIKITIVIAAKNLFIPMGGMLHPSKKIAIRRKL